MINILYLEDNKYDIELTLNELEKVIPDYDIDIANSVNNATQLLKSKSSYDVAILDLNLPDGNGIDCLTYIRDNNLKIPVIILTGSGNEESAIAALKAGADDYLTKKDSYLKQLPSAIFGVIDNFKKNLEKKARPLKVLYIEWNLPDIDFTIRHMKKYAPHITIETIPLATEALDLLPDSPDKDCQFDIILMDYRLPGLNALDTIKIIKQERKLSVPIVLVTGHGNEEIAVQALKMGADEYLVKRKNYLFRLPSILMSSFHRTELEQQQIILKESESKYRILAENSGDVIFIFDLNLKYIYVSPAVKALRGYTVEEALKQNLTDVLTPESANRAKILFSEYLPQKNKVFNSEISPQVLELEMNRKDGTTIWTEVKVSLVMDDNKIPIGIQGVTRDISKRRAALDELYRSREEYKSFFEEDLTGDFISDVNGKIINCNAAYMQILGFKSFQEVKDFDLHNIHTSKESRQNMLENLKKQKKLIWYGHDLKRTDGKIVHVIANIIGGFNDAGELKTIKGYIIDDTERRKATEEIRKLSRAMEQSPATVVITDLNGNIEYTNPIFTKISGYTFEEVKGKNPRILQSGKLPTQTYSELWKSILNGNTWSGELENKHKNGTLYWEFASISPVKNEKGETTHYIAVKEDITEKKKYEEDLIIARDQAQESNRLKSAFLATMSHELRTPLNAIIGFSDLINESMSKEDIIKFCKTINNSGNHLLSIIEDIFTVSLLQTKQSKLLIEEFDLSDFYKDLIQNAKIELNTKDKTNLKLIYNTEIYNSDLKIKTDKTKLFQVILNFIKNAVEYTDQGEIEIGEIIENENITFYVRDTGIGIPSDKKEIIFEHFRQLDDSNTRMHDGVGLGLAICSEIQKLLKGKIRVESEVGKGTTFFFSMDGIIAKKVITKSVKTKHHTINLKEKTILLVEDEIMNYQFLKIYLSRTNVNIIWAKNGEESIEICKNNRNIDLVLMDIKMPGIDGFEATKQIKKLNDKLIVIAQTAYALSEDREKALDAGCDNYISKPIDVQNLMNLLSNYLL